MKELKESMHNVERKYGIYPLVEYRIHQEDMVDDFNRKGFAGVVGHVNYDYDYPNNEAAWEKVKESFHRFLDNGMEGMIYDEFGYPSGTARGVVLENHPEYTAKGAFCYLHFKPLGAGFHKIDLPEGEFLGAFLVDDQTGEVIALPETRTNNGGLNFYNEREGAFYLILMVVRTLFEGTHCTANYCEARKYISMSDADATKEFLRVTHENYYKVLGDEFGKGIKAFFTDEPSLIAYTNQPGPMAILPWHEKYPVEFEKEYGYDIRNAMCAVLFKRGADCAKRKCDFWEYITKTVAEGYFQTIADWCKEHGIVAAGHCLSEENIQWHIVNYGSLYETMKRFDWPGIDMLGTIEEHLMDECFPFAKLAVSVADVYKTGKSLTEFSDIKSTYGGSSVGLSEIYRSVNWHIAMGINQFVSLYSFQDISDDEIYTLNNYVARLNKLMQNGRRDCDIAVLYPDLSAWANYTSNGYFYATDPTEGITNLSATVNKTAWEILHCQRDFDFIDNAVLMNGNIEQGQLVFNTRKYNTVILPYCEVLKEEMVSKLVALLKQGVSIIFVGKVPFISRETGKNEAIFNELQSAVDQGKITFIKQENISMLGQALKAEKFRLSSGNETRFSRLLTQRRMIDEKTYLMMVANIGNEEFQGNIELDGDYEITCFNAKKAEAVECGKANKVSIELGNGEALVYAFVKGEV